MKIPTTKVPWDDQDYYPEEPVKNAVWTKAQKQAEELGMPWNFYLGLLQVAKSLRDNRILTASVDQEGNLKLVYQGYTIKAKIVEIDVEPNDK